MLHCARSAGPAIFDTVLCTHIIISEALRVHQTVKIASESHGHPVTGGHGIWHMCML